MSDKMAKIVAADSHLLRKERKVIATPLETLAGRSTLYRFNIENICVIQEY